MNKILDAEIPTPFLDNFNWRVARVLKGTAIRISAPVAAWGPFAAGEQLVIHRTTVAGSRGILVIRRPHPDEKGVKLTRVAKSHTCTLTLSARTLGIRINPGRHTLKNNEVQRVTSSEDGVTNYTIEFNCVRIGVGDYVDPRVNPKKVTKAEAAPKKIPFKFEGKVTGKLPSAIGLINEMVGRSVIQLEVEPSGKLLVTARFVIEGE